MRPAETQQRLHVLQQYGQTLSQFDMADLEVTENPVYAIDSRFLIILANPAYFQFALKNNGHDIPERFGLGSNLLDAISGTLHDYYTEFFTRALAVGEHVSKEYECSSPELYRLFRMEVYPLPDKQGLLVEHCLVVEKDHEREETETPLESYLDSEGLLHQCSHCRRIRNEANNRWSWSKRALSWKEVSHTLCPRCYGFYYPEFVAE